LTQFQTTDFSADAVVVIQKAAIHKVFSFAKAELRFGVFSIA